MPPTKVAIHSTQVSLSDRFGYLRDTQTVNYIEESNTNFIRKASKKNRILAKSLEQRISSSEKPTYKPLPLLSKELNKTLVKQNKRISSSEKPSYKPKPLLSKESNKTLVKKKNVRSRLGTNSSMNLNQRSPLKTRLGIDTRVQARVSKGLKRGVGDSLKQRLGGIQKVSFKNQDFTHKGFIFNSDRIRGRSRGRVLNFKRRF